MMPHRELARRAERAGGALLLESTAMKFKIATVLVITILIASMTWQCFTWPVVETRELRYTSGPDLDARAQAEGFVRRPPSGPEVVFRCMACAGSLLLGVALVRALRVSRKPHDKPPTT
jgi:hypothetical protein